MERDTGVRRSSRRASKDVSAKKKVLDQIRKHRETGEKVEYAYHKEEDVYEIVAEEEYAQRVQERQEEEFIVDDDGNGYVDDGREIFDDDPNETPDENSNKKSKKDVNKANKGSNVKSSKITNMFNTMPSKKKRKETNITLEGDVILEGILNSIKSTDSKVKNKTVIGTKTPKSSTKKKTLRRLQEKERTVTLKNTSKMANMFAKKPKEEPKEETDDGFVDNKLPELHSVPCSPDSCYESQDIFEIDRKQNKEMKAEEMDESDLVTALDLDEELSDNEMLMDEPVKACEPFDEEKWKTMFDKKFQDDEIPTISTVPSSLPTVNVEGDDVLRFFWLDAYEDKFHQPGTVYLFGKVWTDTTKGYVSCCLAVKNIERQIYLLPRNTRHNKHGKNLEIPIEFKDVYEEFDQKISTKHKIMEYKCRKINKKYAFDKFEVPLESDYLEIVYSATEPQLPADLQGETFSHVFGTNTSSLELLFLNQKLQGPCWLDIKYAQLPKQSISWCKIEAVVDRPSFVTVVDKENLSTPPLTVLSLSMIATTHSKTHAHEIVSLAGHIQPEVYLDKAAPKTAYKQSFCLVTKPSDQLLPFDFQSTVQKMRFNIQISASERSLLGLFLAKIQTIDPDLIVGHDIHGFDFDVLLHRLHANKVPHWSKIGRLKRTTMPKLSSVGKHSFSMNDKNTACGRLVCDAKISAKELIRCQSYDMTKLVSVVLNKQREDMLPEEIPVNLRKTDTLLNMLKNNMADSEYKLKLMYELNILPLAFQITGICGNVMSRTLLGGRSERNEFLLLHAFSKKGYILPDKTSNSRKQYTHDGNENENDATREAGGKKTSKGRKKPAYTGGLVLEPKKGFYDKYILLLDFNSLYPSIIQEYNICFTTISREVKPRMLEEDEEELPEVPSSDADEGILPTEIRRLVERRKLVKGLLKKTSPGSEMYLQYDIRQKALKLTANSMYGCLGFSHSRFYAKPLAALVTGKGREILMKTKDLADGLGYDVIYGDTDSIMINTNSVDLQEVRKIGAKVKSEVNKLYKLVEIDIDGIFKSMLLLKKKKYAAVLVTTRDDGTVATTTELKGLDIVRRDWSDLSKDAGKYVLDQILSSNQRDNIVENIHEYLRTVRDQINDGSISLEKYEIRKSLTKNPDEYPDKKSLPHVTVAQRLMSQGRRIAVGDTISYVICEDGTKLPASQRAYHPDECMKNSNLKIDTHYYLSSQVHPVVSRLCDPIEGTDSAFIASCLGLDSSAYKSAIRQTETDDASSLTALMTDEERFKDVDKFFVYCTEVTCSQFKKQVEFKGSFDTKSDPFTCTSCKNRFQLNRLSNMLTLFMREHISKYYRCWMSCDDQACGYVSRHVSVKNLKNSQICQHCHKGHLHLEYNDGALYNQLLYLRRLFDVNKNILKKDDILKQYWKTLYKKTQGILDTNAYSIVNISALF